MDDLTAFITARLDEDEAAAKAAASVAGPNWYRDAQYLRSEKGAYLADAGSVDDEELAPFWARHDPSRVLREVAAKRAIVKQAALLARVPPNRAVALIAEDMLRHLAAVWSDHPDYPLSGSRDAPEVPSGEANRTLSLVNAPRNQ